MGAKRKLPEEKVYTVCGTVKLSTLRKIQFLAGGSRTVARVSGDILEDWALGVPEVVYRDDRQDSLDLVGETEGVAEEIIFLE